MTTNIECERREQVTCRLMMMAQSAERHCNYDRQFGALREIVAVAKCIRRKQLQVIGRYHLRLVLKRLNRGLPRRKQNAAWVKSLAIELACMTQRFGGTFQLIFVDWTGFKRNHLRRCLLDKYNASVVDPEFAMG